MLTPPITKQAKQQEWKIILATAQNNGFPLYIIHKETDSQKTKTKTSNHKKATSQKWVVFSHHGPLIRKITNLFKHSNLNIALRTTITIHYQLTDKIFKTSTNSRGKYRLKRNACNNSYVGQSG
jgi:hypothetical protein